MSRQQIYCGNNLYEVGNRRIGTPYQCLKKGIGQGLNSDLTGFNPNYQAIIADNTYCGTKAPPVGKQMGTPTSCLRKGVGIGKKLQYDRRGESYSRTYPHDIVESFKEMRGGDKGGQQLLLTARTPLLSQPKIIIPVSGGWRSFLMRWWPVIVALLVGVVAAIFKATYTTILLTMIIMLVVGWFMQSVMDR
jgi:hypothetical protein